MITRRGFGLWRVFPASVLALASVLIVSGMALGDVIDDFQDPSPKLTITNETATYSNTTSASVGTILGGSRKMTLSGTEISGGSFEAWGHAASETLNYSAPTSAYGNLTLTYDGNGTGLSSALDGLVALVIDFADLDLGFADELLVEVTVEDQSNVSDQNSATIDFTSEFPFAVPIDLTGLSVDWTDIKSLKVFFEGDPDDGGGVDFTLSGISGIVPEPGSLAIWCLIGLTFVGVGCRRNRVCG